MLARLVSYLIAFVVLAGVELPFVPITLALSMSLRKARSLVPFLTSLLDAIKICCGVLFASWFIHKIGQAPSWLMFLIPGYLMLQNNLMRINRVKGGRSNVKRMHEQSGEPGLYDQRLDLWVERGHLLGDVVGWAVGTNLVLQSASFF